jgi:uncharacterized lipoprotein
MKKIVVLALAAASVAACASDSDRMQAALQCQEVGITAASPDYATCLTAYTSMKREGTLKTAFRNMVNPTEPDRRRPHQDQIF